MVAQHVGRGPVEGEPAIGVEHDHAVDEIAFFADRPIVVSRPTLK